MKDVNTIYNEIVKDFDIPESAWVLLRANLPCIDPPPFASIHFSKPWPLCDINNKEAIVKQYRKEDKLDQYLGLSNDLQRMLFARKISYKGQMFRIFPEEYAILTQERLDEYVEHLYDLVIDSSFIEEDNMFTDKEEFNIFEHAILDGCSKLTAYQLAKGNDVSENCADPIGWFKIKETVI